jgi:hypothetical protein
MKPYGSTHTYVGIVIVLLEYTLRTQTIKY